MRKPSREFCGLKRNSDSFALATLLYGMLPKLLPIPLPASLSRKTAVTSRKPIGIMLVSPIFNCRGDAVTAVVSFCGTAAGRGAGVVGTTIGVVDAISGRDGDAGCADANTSIR